MTSKKSTSIYILKLDDYAEDTFIHSLEIMEPENEVGGIEKITMVSITDEKIEAMKVPDEHLKKAVDILNIFGFKVTPIRDYIH